jgi:hypothetical protein
MNFVLASAQAAPSIRQMPGSLPDRAVGQAQIFAPRNAKSLDGADEAPVVHAHLLGLAKRPRALFIDASEIVLHIGDVGLEVLSDQFGIGLHVFLCSREKRTLRRNTCRPRAG